MSISREALESVFNPAGNSMSIGVFDFNGTVIFMPTAQNAPLSSSMHVTSEFVSAFEIDPSADYLPI